MNRGPRRVYFIKPVGMDGPVKIGCSQSPNGRRETLETWAPFALEIVAEIEGGFDIERRFHSLFADSYLRREWFNWTPELGRVIAEITAGAFDIRALPEGKGAGSMSALHHREAPLSQGDSLGLVLPSQEVGDKIDHAFGGLRPPGSGELAQAVQRGDEFAVDLDGVFPHDAAGENNTSAAVIKGNVFKGTAIEGVAVETNAAVAECLAPVIHSNKFLRAGFDNRTIADAGAAASHRPGGGPA